MTKFKEDNYYDQFVSEKTLNFIKQTIGKKISDGKVISDKEWNSLADYCVTLVPRTSVASFNLTKEDGVEIAKSAGTILKKLLSAPIM